MSWQYLIDLGFGNILDWSIYDFHNRNYVFLVNATIIERLIYVYTRSGSESAMVFGNFFMEIKGYLLAIQEDPTWKSNTWFQEQYRKNKLHIEANFIFWICNNPKIFSNLVTSMKIFVKRVKVIYTLFFLKNLFQFWFLPFLLFIIMRHFLPTSK